jgi:ankyrin repeat protein
MTSATAIDNLLFTAVLSKDLTKINNAIEAGANINALNVNRESALLLAIKFHPNIVNLSLDLLKRGADFTIKDREGRTAIDIAKEKSPLLYQKIIKEIKSLSEHDNNEIKEVTYSRLEKIGLNINEIEIDISIIENNKNIEKKSWKNRCLIRKSGCIIS